MPANLVKTKQDEEKWKQAKRLAQKAGQKDNWAYVVSIFKNLKGEKEMKEDFFTYKGWKVELDRYNNGGYKIIATKGRKKIIDYEGAKKTLNDATKLAKKWIDAYENGEVGILRKIGLKINEKSILNRLEKLKRESTYYISGCSLMHYDQIKKDWKDLIKAYHGNYDKAISELRDIWSCLTDRDAKLICEGKIFSESFKEARNIMNSEIDRYVRQLSSGGWNKPEYELMKMFNAKFPKASTDDAVYFMKQMRILKLKNESFKETEKLPKVGDKYKDITGQVHIVKGITSGGMITLQTPDRFVTTIVTPKTFRKQYVKESFKETDYDDVIVVDGKQISAVLSGSGTKAMGDDGNSYVKVNGKWIKEESFEADTKYKNMSVDEAKRILGNRAKWELQNMKKALMKFRMMNSEEEEKRLAAVRVLLKHSKEDLTTTNSSGAVGTYLKQDDEEDKKEKILNKLNQLKESFKEKKVKNIFYHGTTAEIQYDDGSSIEVPQDEVKYLKLEEADYPWDKCIADQKKAGHSDEEARKICGAIKYRNESFKEKNELLLAQNAIRNAMFQIEKVAQQMLKRNKLNNILDTQISVNGNGYELKFFGDANKITQKLIELEKNNNKNLAKKLYNLNASYIKITPDTYQFEQKLNANEKTFINYIFSAAKIDKSSPIYSVNEIKPTIKKIQQELINELNKF